MKEISKEYSNGTITIVWKPRKCIHSRICWQNMPEVFDPQSRPWIHPESAPSSEIVELVKKCPSGALSYYYNAERDNSDKKSKEDSGESPATETTVSMAPDGPLLITGRLRVIRKDGAIDLKPATTAFCRCGGTQNQPYCDGTHEKNNFKG